MPERALRPEPNHHRPSLTAVAASSRLALQRSARTPGPLAEALGRLVTPNPTRTAVQRCCDHTGSPGPRDEEGAPVQRCRDNSSPAVPSNRPEMPIQQVRSGAGRAIAPAGVQEVLRSGGNRLDAPTRSLMESRLGHDFGQVRIHRDASADTVARAMGARALTSGTDVVFAQGQYAPETPIGRHLLAHELSHVVQQRQGAVDGRPVGDGLRVSDPSDRYERAAERTASTAFGDTPARPEEPRSAGRGSVIPPLTVGTPSRLGEHVPTTKRAPRRLARVPQDRGSIQRQPADATAPSGASAPAARADATARDAGPCAVLAEPLSNAGLLFQLNRARVYLTQHPRGEGQFFDYANLLRRLGDERRRRIRGGQVWLAERGLIDPPARLYVLVVSGPLQVAVVEVPGSTAIVSDAVTVLTERQFGAFLANRGVTETDPQRYFRQRPADGSPAVATVDLPPVTRPGLSVDLSTLGGPQSPSGSLPGMGRPRPFSPFGPDGPLSPLNPLGLPPASPVLLRWPLVSAGPVADVTIGASEHLADLRRNPDAVTGGGPERVYIPRSPDVGPAVVVMAPREMGGGPGGTGPVGVGSLGFTARPGWGLPEGSTGFMWEGSHVIDLALLNGTMSARGFRAGFPTHAAADILGPGSGATATLNVGTPGSYANDAAFIYGGELWGRGTLSPKHWGRGSVAIMTMDGRAPGAEAMLQVMLQTLQASEGATYRFSTPPASSGDGSPTAAFRNASEEAARRGIPHWCDLGGQNCINFVADAHEFAANGLPLEIRRADGTVIDLRDPAHASARNMSEFMNSVPDDVLASHGLQRVDLGARAWRGVGVAGAAGAGMSILGDAWRDTHGEDVGGWRYAGDAALGGTSSAVSAIGETYLSGAFTNSLMSRGVGAGSASMLGRVGGAGGVAVIVAPITTGLEMAFSDQDYIYIDYAARMTRSGAAAAGGGAIAAGVVGAIWGSEVPIAGNIVGFIVGVGGYYAIDAFAGDEIEDSVRVGLGEPGCTEGVGPGH